MIFGYDFLSFRRMGSVRSMDPAEDYAQRYLRQAAAQVIENTGFSHCSESALNIISDLTRRFMEKLWYDGKLFAEHGKFFYGNGRSYRVNRFKSYFSSN